MEKAKIICYYRIWLCFAFLIMKRFACVFSLTLSCMFLASGCSYFNEKLNPKPPQPKRQKILRVWRGNEFDNTSKSVCGIYASPETINKYQSEGWAIKTSNPINYRLEQRFHYVNCLASEVVLEKWYLNSQALDCNSPKGIFDLCHRTQVGEMYWETRFLTRHQTMEQAVTATAGHALVRCSWDRLPLQVLVGSPPKPHPLPPAVIASKAPAVEVVASSCFRRTTVLAGLGLELWGWSNDHQHWMARPVRALASLPDCPSSRQRLSDRKTTGTFNR